MKQLDEVLGDLGLSPAQVEGLLFYLDLLTTVGRPLGLIGFHDSDLPEQLIRSLLIRQVIAGSDVADVGSGAGFPGVPLAVAGLSVTFIEPRRKAAAFLEKVIRGLKLPATLHIARAEDLAGELGGMREAFETVTARALGSFPKTLQTCAPLCAPGGRVVVTAKPSETYPPIDLERLGTLGLQEGRTVELNGPLAIRQRVHIMGKASAAPPGDRPS